MNLPHGYEPSSAVDRQEPFIVLEGVSGIGKSTLAKLLSERLGGTGLHTLPDPHSEWSGHANRQLRPLPQFAFYLSGLLHASDVVRRDRALGPVIADRYASSVIACHAAVNRVGVEDVARFMAPFRPYLEIPHHTFYLRCSEAALRDRMTAKETATGLTPDDQDLFDVPGRLAVLLANFEAVAADDPTAVPVDTDNKTPEELADWIANRLETDRA
ncbi:dTMP kinase [Streptomyces sp. NPDC056347]|uniref:dTMP kinase n=1 Tax=Streptomyces sp. NPDC056347 TaxID=3345790 RepID=UPI0035D95C64